MVFFNTVLLVVATVVVFVAQAHASSLPQSSVCNNVEPQERAADEDKDDYAMLKQSDIVIDTKDEGAGPVRVLVCTEALCPGCKEFVLQSLLATYHHLGHEIMLLDLIPFGNAKFEPGAATTSSSSLRPTNTNKKDDETLTCQHGTAECDANSWEQCLVYYAADPDRYLPIIQCLEHALPDGYNDKPFERKVFKDCFEPKHDDLWNVVEGCHDDPEMASHLQHRFYKKTPKKHQYVPWVEVDDVLFEDFNQKKFQKAICHAYAKKNKGKIPNACNQSDDDDDENYMDEKEMEQIS